MMIDSVIPGTRPSAKNQNKIIKHLNEQTKKGLVPGDNPITPTAQRECVVVKGNNISSSDFSVNDAVAIVGNNFSDETGDVYSIGYMTTIDVISQQDSEQDITVGVCLDFIPAGMVGRVLLVGTTHCRVYRPTTGGVPGNLRVAGPKPSYTYNALCVGEWGAMLLWEDTSGSLYEPHNALVLLSGYGSSGAESVVARWAAYEDE